MSTLEPEDPMTRFTDAFARPHVEAFCSTGSSPGRRARAVTDLSHEGRSPSRGVMPYELHGPTHAPPVVVLGGISAGRHLTPTTSDPTPGWWPGVVGAGRVLDPATRLLIGADYLGALPSPSAGDASCLRTPTTHDQAHALRAVLDDLGLRSATFVGASYGGMVALAFAELFPERVSRLVVLCAAHRSHPMATGLRSLQRRAVRLGIEFGAPDRGLELARGLAMTTYRSVAEFEDRFDSAPLAERVAPVPLEGSLDSSPLDSPQPDRTSLDGGAPDGAWARFPVEEYLEARGAHFARNFTPDRFIALSESIDLHRCEPRRVPSGTRLLSVDSDALVPPWLVDELVLGASGSVSHVQIRSRFGHDAFLKEIEAVSAVIDDGLTSREVGR